MFLTFEGMYTMVQDLSGDDTSARLTGFKRDINVATGILRHELSRYIFEETRTITTVANQQSYELDPRLIRIHEVTYTTGGIPYLVNEIASRAEWRLLNEASTSSSNIPRYWYADKDQIHLFPKPAAASDTITIYGEERVPDMTAADYTTGTITTLANGDDDVTGSGTTWTAAFVSRWLRVTSNGIWYEIESRSSNTAIVLVKNYQGTSISAGSEAYTIGEQTLGSYEDLHVLPVWYALMQYYGGIMEDAGKRAEYLALWTAGKQNALDVYGKRTGSAIIPGRRMRRLDLVEVNRSPTLS